ncbi:beta-ketoacyl synthase chain length factor [Pollutibacter soli]|uniref:beta-ketoacyl synthase chain length factor n=1 Tax=Pollutibacter soli TaxID=3034157 RepID=UPI0030140EFA
MKLYIHSSSAISPQPGFTDEGFPAQIRKPESNRFDVVEPEYREWIDPKLIRRMSRIIRMGVAAAKKSLQTAKLEMPDAIITGTAYGCLEDTGVFIQRMVEQGEEMLSPTAFIQSTHNTVAAQIALLLKCHNYNNTFVHRAFSFESALLDAALLLEENPRQKILVGAADEITSYSYDILSRFDIYKKNEEVGDKLIGSGTTGTIAGEGSAFFVISGEKNDQSISCIDDFASLYKPVDAGETEKFIIDFLKSSDTDIKNVDLILSGHNGDNKGDAIYDALQEKLFGGIPMRTFKNYCGEYPTAISFALWYASLLISENAKGSPKKILIWNHYKGTHHSLILLSAC